MTLGRACLAFCAKHGIATIHALRITTVIGKRSLFIGTFGFSCKSYLMTSSDVDNIPALGPFASQPLHVAPEIFVVRPDHAGLLRMKSGLAGTDLRAVRRLGGE
jgi:hypothetical protein